MDNNVRMLSLISSVNLFIEHADLYGKVLGFEGIVEWPYGYNLNILDANNMKDIISFHEKMYLSILKNLKDILSETMISSKKIQKETLGFITNFKNRGEANKELDDFFENAIKYELQTIKSSENPYKEFMEELREKLLLRIIE